jgi:hypothetical protein
MKKPRRRYVSVNENIGGGAGGISVGDNRAMKSAYSAMKAKRKEMAAGDDCRSNGENIRNV